MKTYSKKKSGDGTRSEDDRFDRLVAASHGTSQTSSLNTRPFDSVQKSGQMTEEMSDTWTWTYTYGTGSVMTASGADLSPIEVPRKEQPEYERSGISDIILPKNEDDVDDKVQRWLQDSQNESPEPIVSSDLERPPLKGKEPVQRSRRMNSTLLDTSRAQNAEDAMGFLQGISTIHEDEEIFYLQSKGRMKGPKDMQQLLETTPRVSKKSKAPGTPVKTLRQDQERKGVLKPKKADSMFGTEFPGDKSTAGLLAKTKHHTKASNSTCRQTLKGQSTEDGIPNDGGEGDSQQDDPPWVSFRQRSQKKSAKTSTPCRRTNISDHLKMFSVDLSSVNPGNETGVDLQVSTSRFVNSNEIVTESDYLKSLSTVACTFSGLKPIQESTSMASSREISAGKSNASRKSVQREKSLTKQLSKMTIDVLSVQSESENEQTRSQEKQIDTSKLKKSDKTDEKLTPKRETSMVKKTTMPIRQPKPRRIQSKRQTTNTRNKMSNKSAPKRLASTRQRMGAFPKINLSGTRKKKKATPRQKGSNSKLDKVRKERAKTSRGKDKGSHTKSKVEVEHALGLQDAFSSPPELPRGDATRRITARRDRLESFGLPEHGPPDFVMDVIEDRGDEVFTAVEPTSESVPVCCITLFDEVNAERRTDYEPIKVDYHSIIAGVPQDCLELFD